jgi:hypothetical protein
MGGASVIQQALNAGLADSLHLHVAPVLRRGRHQAVRQPQTPDRAGAHRGPCIAARHPPAIPDPQITPAAPIKPRRGPNARPLIAAPAAPSSSARGMWWQSAAAPSAPGQPNCRSAARGARRTAHIPARAGRHIPRRPHHTGTPTPRECRHVAGIGDTQRQQQQPDRPAAGQPHVLPHGQPFSRAQGRPETTPTEAPPARSPATTLTARKHHHANRQETAAVDTQAATKGRTPSRSTSASAPDNPPQAAHRSPTASAPRLQPPALRRTAALTDRGTA